MASIYKSGSGYRVQVYVRGVRDSAVLPTRKEAAAWALQREAELTGRKLPAKTFGDALRAYAREVSPSHKGERWELIRLASLRREPIARHQLAGLADTDFIAWRNARLKGDPPKVKPVSPGTVAREMNLMRAVLTHCVTEWKWLRSNPMKGVKWPETPRGRRRRVSADEVTAIRLAFGIGKDYRGQTQTQRVGLAFLFALETAMRSGEILALEWADVHLGAQYLTVRKSKNGDEREVPLSKAACDILRAIPGENGAVFGVDDQMRDALWRKNRPAALKDLHFHDSRGEAIWRLSKKLDLLQLCQVIGQRDPKSLLHYYRESAADMATRLG